MSTHAQEGNIPEWTVGDRIRKAREFANMDQADLATASDISRRTITSYEQNTTHPRRPQLLAIALATGVPWQWLATGEVHLKGPDRGGLQPSGWTHALALAA